MKTRSRKHPAGLTVKKVLIITFVFFALLFILMLVPHSHRGSDRSMNILNIRNVQAAVRGHAILKQLEIGDPLKCSEIVSDDGKTGYMKTPRPPVDLPPYTYRSDIPPLGTLYVTNHFDHPKYGFISPKDYEEW